MMRALKGSTLYLLEAFILLVYHEYKDAYLVDTCSLNSEAAKELLAQVERKFKLSPGVLGLVLLLDDVFIVNVCVVHRRLDFEETSLDSELIISTSGGVPAHLQGDSARLLRSEVATTIAGVFDPPHRINLCSSALGSLSAPYVAGWLLGYPCQYHSPSHDDSSQPSMTMTDLCKVSIIADVQVATGVGGTKGSIKQWTNMEILGFSIPTALLEADTELAATFMRKVDSLFQRFADKKGSVQESLFVGNVRLERLNLTVPAIVL